ncbi:MAG: urease accessory UreF family protein [Acetobacteraceae bacterium]
MSTGIEALLLHAWLSPAFPTGGFAYSHGIEWAVEAGDVADETGLLDWLADLLAHGSGRNDAILLRHACRADPTELASVCAFAMATAGGRERLAETLGQGDAFARAALVWGSPRLAGLVGPVPYPVAVGALAADHGVAEDAVVAAFLQAMAGNLISAAVRLIPLGQTAGLRVLAALQPRILAVAREIRGAALDDIGGACFRADIAAMRHETQRTRLFRT